MVGAKPDGQLQHRDVDGARLAYVSGILFIQEDSPDEIGTAVAKFVCNSRPSGLQSPTSQGKNGWGS
jgi:hypothetical protein